MPCDVFASAPLVADEEPGFPTVAHDVCGTNIGSLSQRAEPHSPCNLGIALGLWTTTLYVVEIRGAQTFGEGQRRFGGAEPGSRVPGQHAKVKSRTELLDMT